MTIYNADAAAQRESVPPYSQMGRYRRAIGQPPSFRVAAADLISEIKRMQALGYSGWRYDLFPWSKLITNLQTLELDQQELNLRIAALKYAHEQGFPIMLTLWHWDYPRGLEYGWAKKQTREVFVAYVRKLLPHLRTELAQDGIELAEAIPRITILNEPMVNAANAYLLGWLPPRVKNPLSYLRALRNLSLVVNPTIKTIKSIDDKIKVSLTKNIAAFTIQKTNPFMELVNQVATQAAKYYDRHLYFHLIGKKARKALDEFSLNYWHSWITDCGDVCQASLWLSDYGWHLDPVGLDQVLEAVHKMFPKKPIVITELGAHLEPAREHERKQYYDQCLDVVRKARERGICVELVCLWGADVDNLEWGKAGFAPTGKFEVIKKGGDWVTAPKEY